jgi:hypothetical protein
MPTLIGMAQTSASGEGYDPEAVANAARAQDPSIDLEVAIRLAREAARHVAAGARDPAEVARRCLAEHPETDASWANHVARAAIEQVARGVSGG